MSRAANLGACLKMLIKSMSTLLTVAGKAMCWSTNTIPNHSFFDYVTEDDFPLTDWRPRQAQTVRNLASSHKINYAAPFLEILKLNGY